MAYGKIRLLAAAACFAALAGPAHAATLPRVVVVVLADDLGYGDLSCYGASKIQTPHIDRLAASGIRFTDAHSSSAVCTPSRYSLLTGQYAWRTRLKKGVLDAFDPPLIDAVRPTLGTLFQQAGYKTACIGKWHLGVGWPVKSGGTPSTSGDNVDYAKPLTDTPLDHGFDYFFGISGSLDFPPYAFIENRQMVGKVETQKKIRFDSQRPGLQADGWDDVAVDTLLVKKTVETIRRHARSDEKIFVYLALPAPHRPCVPPDLVDGKSGAGRRGDMVMLVDWAVGQLVDLLKSEGLFEQSMVVVTSDNGARPGDGVNPPELKFYEGTTQLPVRGEVDVEGHRPEKWVSYGHRANGDFRGYKTDIYEGGHRVPLVVHAPSLITQPWVCTQAVGLTDWYATFQELLGVEHVGGGEDSISLAAILKGGASPRDHVVHHSAKGMFAIREGQWKYVDGAGSGGVTVAESGSDAKGQLFDLSSDPAEACNVAADFPEVVERLKTQLHAIID